MRCLPFFSYVRLFLTSKSITKLVLHKKAAMECGPPKGRQMKSWAIPGATILSNGLSIQLGQ
jgi:hypothetical protein